MPRTKLVKKLASHDDATFNKLTTLVSLFADRRNLATKFGTSFNGSRSMYDVLGYTTDLTFAHYMGAYDRGDIAARIIDAAPQSTWRRKPIVSNDSDPDNFTPFELAWAKLAQDRRVFHYMERADKLAGIGHYGVLLIGTSDVRNVDDLERPMARLKGPESVLYLAPFTEDSAGIEQIDGNPASERFGLPELYNVTMRGMAGTTFDSKVKVHWSRIIHIAEGLRENDFMGTPRLRAVFNRLDDVMKIAGGSAEIFWQAAKRIMVLQAKEGFSPVDSDDALTDMMEELVHGLRRVIDVQGYDVKTLDPSKVEPDEAFRVSLALISSATGIPQRILLGSEQGKMASTQDEVNWNGKIADRQLNFAEPVVLRPFIDRLILVGALPAPEGDYILTWPSLFELSDKEKAQIGLLKSRTLAQYIGKAGENLEISQTLVPIEELRGDLLNLRARKIETVKIGGGGQGDNLPDKPAAAKGSTAVNIQTTPINVTIPEREIHVHVNTQEPKVDIHVENKPADIHVKQPDITVNVESPKRTPMKIERDSKGLITRTVPEK